MPPARLEAAQNNKDKMKTINVRVKTKRSCDLTWKLDRLDLALKMNSLVTNTHNQWRRDTHWRDEIPKRSVEVDQF